MKFILDLSTAQKPHLFFFEKKEILGVLFCVAVLLLVIIYHSAQKLALHWIHTNSPQVTQLVDKAIEQRHLKREQLWEKSLDNLLEDISAMQSNIIELQQNGIVMADYIGLSGNILFKQAVPDQLSQPLLQPAPRQEKVAQINSWLQEKNDAFHTIKKNYGIIKEQSIKKVIAAKTIPMVNPVLGKNWQTSGYGYRKGPFSKRKAFHAGYDYSARRGTPVAAGADGFVIFAGRLGRYGNMVQIYHGNGVSTVYGHLHKIKTSKWAYVKGGEVIGTVGSTGRSTGPHLHYEVRLDNKPQAVRRAIKQLKTARNV